MPNSTCRWPDCDTAKIKGRGLCNRHYQHAWKAGDFDTPWVRRSSLCLWPDCTVRPMVNSYCHVHQQRADRFPEASEPWLPWAETAHSRARQRVITCIWPGCDSSSECRSFCYRHYFRARKIGDYETPWESWCSTCSTCGVQYCSTQVRIKGRNYCTNACRYRSKRLIHPERERDRRMNRFHSKRQNGEAEPFRASELRERDGDLCYICGNLIDFTLRWPLANSPSLDHIIPLSKGGAHARANAAMTHLVCNMRKGAKLLTHKGVIACPDSFPETVR